MQFSPSLEVHQSLALTWSFGMHGLGEVAIWDVTLRINLPKSFAEQSALV